MSYVNPQTKMPYSIGTVTLSNGIKVFYREAGDPAKHTILLLHGFPSSSHQYRNLIPLLAHDYHVIAPDYPGFGFTVVPDSVNFVYTFDNLAATVGSFLDAKKITNFIPYVFDYGAPVGFRIALERPKAIKAIITQNGNAYDEGLGKDFWAPLRRLWAATTPEEIKVAQEPIRARSLTLNGVRHRYEEGSVDPSVIEPEAYWLDSALFLQPRNIDHQLAMLKDYKSNVEAYPAWQAYLREYQPKILAAWGKNDRAFTPPGAEAFKRDVPDTEVHLIDAGHFPLETNLAEMTGYILDFLKRTV